MSEIHIKKPDPKAVRERGLERLAALDEEVSKKVDEACRVYKDQSKEISIEASKSYNEKEDEFYKEIEESEFRIDDMEEVVECADEEIKRLKALLAEAKEKKAKAKEDLKLVKRGETKLQESLKDTFNQEAREIWQAAAEKEKEVKAIYDTIAEEQYGKFREVYEQMKEEVRNERKALDDYEVFKLRAGIRRIENGVKRFFTDAVKGAREGYQMDPGVALPESLKNRVVAKPDAESGTANDNKAQPDERKNGTRGPKGPGL